MEERGISGGKYGSSPPHPYRHPDGSPRLRDSLVVYLDQMGTEAEAAHITDEVLAQRQQLWRWFHRFIGHVNNRESLRAIYFSDNVVLAVPIDQATQVEKERALHHVIDGASTIAVGMAALGGVVFRGGLSRGPVFVDDNVIDDEPRVSMAHGPALVEAVRMEEETARYPRVQVGESVLGWLDELVGSLDFPDSLVPERFAMQILRDVEDPGVWFVDHLAQGLTMTEISIGPGGMSRAEVIRRLQQLVAVGRDSAGEKVRAKYDWLAAYLEFVEAGHRPGLEPSGCRFRHWRGPTTP